MTAAWVLMGAKVFLVLVPFPVSTCAFLLCGGGGVVVLQ
mgnify:CR=1 FL=1